VHFAHGQLVKIWHALNWAISDKMLYFYWQGLNLSVQSLNQKITEPLWHKLHSTLSSTYKLREVSNNLGRTIFGAIPSHFCPLLRCVLVVLHLTLRWNHLGRATLIFFFFWEIDESQTLHSLESIQISFLVYYKTQTGFTDSWTHWSIPEMKNALFLANMEYTVTVVSR